MTYVQCDCGDKAVVDRTKLLMSNPPQYEARCMGCNAISYVPAGFVAPDWKPTEKPSTLMLELAVEALLRRVKRLEKQLGMPPFHEEDES